MQWIFREISKSKESYYVCANCKECHNLYQEGSTFEMGKGNILKNGDDVLIISEGELVNEALDCAEVLDSQGISTEVIDMFCIKPIDVELILSEIKGKKAVVTFENHSIIGGLGSAVAEVLAETSAPVKFKRHGVNERFGQVGSPKYLQEEFQLTARDLEKTIKDLLA